MYVELFTILFPIVMCASVGFAWARSGTPYESEFVSRLVMNIGAPCLVVGTLSKVELPAASLNTILLAALIVLVSTASIAWLICQFFRLPHRIYLGPLTFPNTVNMGLPVSLFAFGEQGLAIAIGIYLVVSLCQFTLGVALVSGENAWRNSLRSPIVFSGLIGAALVFSDTRLPLWLENGLNLLGSCSIPLMLITLGVSLSQLKVRQVGLSACLGMARILTGASVGWLVADWLALQGAERGVLILQSAMPAAVFNYLIAFRYQQSPEAVAGLVVMSTFFSLISLPILLWLVL